jgi:hypothetical protein
MIIFCIQFNFHFEKKKNTLHLFHSFNSHDIVNNLFCNLVYLWAISIVVRKKNSFVCQGSSGEISKQMRILTLCCHSFAYRQRHDFIRN